MKQGRMFLSDTLSQVLQNPQSDVLRWEQKELLCVLLIITKYEVTLQMGLELPNRFSELPRDHIFGKWTPLTPALSYDQVLKKAETNGQCIRAKFCILILGSIVKTLKHWGNLIFWHPRRCNIKFTFGHNCFKMPFFCHF